MISLFAACVEGSIFTDKEKRTHSTLNHSTQPLREQAEIVESSRRETVISPKGARVVWAKVYPVDESQ